MLGVSLEGCTLCCILFQVLAQISFSNSRGAGRNFSRRGGVILNGIFLIALISPKHFI